MLKRLDNKKKQAMKNLMKNAKFLKEKEQDEKDKKRKALNRLVEC